MILHFNFFVNSENEIRYNTYMQILSTSGWNNYELLDSGDGMRYERFGPYTIVRPDPQAIWQPSQNEKQWNEADVKFVRTSQDKGTWKFKRHIPEKWLMHWKDLSFWVRLTSFKHTGVFPEQSLQWEWIQDQIRFRYNSVHQIKSSGPESRKKPEISDMSEKTDISDVLTHRIPSEYHLSILNLFAYTGIATLAAASAGAKVTHVDSSKPTITWARENAEASKLADKPIRWILDDAGKFVERELKRGTKYDGIIMDPPVYGHGPTGQIWKFNENFPKLLKSCMQLLSDKPLFIIVNAYAISSSAIMLENVLQDNLKMFKGLPAGRQGKIEVGELCLQESQSKRLLSTGIFARWNR